MMPVFCLAFAYFAMLCLAFIRARRGFRKDWTRLLVYPLWGSVSIAGLIAVDSTSGRPEELLLLLLMGAATVIIAHVILRRVRAKDPVD